MTTAKKITVKKLDQGKKALGIFKELITTTGRRITTTKVAFGDPPSGSKNCGKRYILILE